MTKETRGQEDQQKLLLEIIKRFDTYINACNAKVAVILSYCIAYIGGLGFKLADIADKREHDIAWWVLLGISLLSAIATLASAYFAYKALSPQTPSGRAPHESPSAIFFGDVATHPGGRDGYVASVENITSEEVVKDLASQAHVLATITQSKFALVKKATSLIANLQIPLFLITIALMITSLTITAK